MTRWCSDAAAGGGEGNERWRGYPAPFSDSVHGNDEEEVARLLPRSTLLGEAPNGGLAAAGTGSSSAARRELGRERRRGTGSREQVGREQGQAGVALTTKGATAWARGGAGARRGMAPVQLLEPQWRGRRES